MSRTTSRLGAPALTRRTFVGASAGLAAAALAGGARIGAQESSPTASGTRTVETINGAIEVPANPQRVVTISYITAIAAAELGVIPVGIPKWLPDLPADFPDMSEVALIENDAWELDVEAIIALEPDLIIGSDVLDEANRSVPYETLSAIAPTALFEWVSGGAAWEPQAAGTADALGKAEEHAALRTAYEERAAGIKTTYQAALESLTIDFIDAGESEWYLHGPASTHCKVAIEAGVQLGAGADQEETFKGYSFELLNLLEETGALVVRGGEFGSLPILSEQPTFTGLPAVQKRFVMTSEFFYVASYAQANGLLDELEQGLRLLSMV